MRKIWRILKEYVIIWRNMWRIWRSMSKIWRNMWKIWRHRLHNIVSETWENSEFSLFIWALGLGKIPRPSFLLGSETWKNSELCLPLYRLCDLKKCWASPCFDYSLLARCHSFFSSIISSKLFLLTYSSKPQKCECLGRWLPQTRAVSTQHISS